LLFKRFIDIALSAAGMIFLSPVYLLLMLAIKTESKGPILFKQRRVGLYKRHFNILKFRTMREDTPKDTPTHLFSNPDKYMTKSSKFLRKTSIDELQQIWNIYRGDMSAIGPRPALWKQEDLIAERDKYYVHSVKPGLTGWAQINGRDEMPIKVKAKFDGYYVEHMGVLMDIKCFVGTFVSVAKSDGIVEGETGNNKQRMEWR